MRESLISGFVALALCGAATAQQTVEEARVAHSQAIANEAIAHADIQTSMMESKFKAFGFLQFRWMYNSVSPTGSQMGFNVRKAVIGLEGEVADNWNFVLSGEWVPDASFDLRDAYITTDFDGVGFTAGRFRMPFMAEWQVNEPQLLGNDYSLIAYTFGQGRSEGVQLSHSMGDFKFLVSYNNGFEQENEVLFNNDTWGMSGRVEWTGMQDLTVGAALAYNNTDSYHNLNWTVDGNYHITSQWFAFASYTGRSDDVNGDGWGVLVQTGYEYDENLTLFGQYQVGDITGSVDLLSVLSAGATYMFAENVRWTNQAGYSFNSIADGWNVNETGWSNTSTDGQFLFTTQLTVSF
jgi:hypothetical protein